MGVLMNTPDPPSPESSESRARQAALDYGIDLSLTDYLLSLTPAERIEQHDQASELVRALRQAGIDYYGFDPRNPAETERPRR